MSGNGFAYRLWRLYGAPDSLFLSLMGVDTEAREKFLQKYWTEGHR